ncbi:MAG: ABC transporter ATP-binding protein [Anaerolineaceae bacterium]|jgi:ABC-type Fe3+/spermidine/putrescine transport system ATPase subunit|nr:MAG: ABC transporter ATP-binding protein [Anaerolineaceae bacterium]
MLELRNVVKYYEGRPLLRDISFTVSQGETVCLLGASGSGKSTILRMIAGLDFPERGAILLNDLDLAQTPPHLRDFGLVFQDYGLFPHLNVFDNIAFGLKMLVARRGRSPLAPPARAGVTSPNAQESAFYARDKIQHRVHELLEQVNLVGFDSRKVTDLSGGEQQRVALARALAPQPRLLMFDEPLGALDRSLKEDLLNEIRGILHQTKIPAIYVTHDQEEAFTIADRILVLHEGTIIRDAAPHEIWREPKSAVVAKLLGIGNVIGGEVISENKVKTVFGVFNLDCAKSIGEKIQLLLTESPSPSGRGAALSLSKGARGEGKPPSPFRRGDGGEVIEEIQLTVEDILFKQDQFQVKARGGINIHMKDAPRIGDVITVKVQVQCLS